MDNQVIAYESLKTVAILSAIPLVMFAIWADYTGKKLKPDNIIDLHKIRITGFLAVMAQVIVFLATTALRSKNPIASTLVFLTSLVAQSILQIRLELKVRNPSPGEAKERMALSMKGLVFLLLGAASWLGIILLCLASAVVLGRFLVLPKSLSVLLPFAGALTGIILSLVFNFAFAPFFLRHTLSVEQLGKGDLRDIFSAIFQKCGFKPAAVWVIKNKDRFSLSTAFVAGLRGGVGPFKPSLFISKTIVDHFRNDEILAILLHEIGHVLLNHLRNRLALSITLIICTTAAGVFLSIFMYSVFAGFQLLIGPIIAIAALVFSLKMMVRQGRRQEMAADIYSMEAMGGDPQSLIQA
ncbi:MAG: M48 family metalloprotease, partial [Bdellovibrionota bacterium]